MATALVFNFTNGFHDTANAMATTIATEALPPRRAVGLAAVLNLVGAFLSVAVAATIASGIVDQGMITVPVIFAGLIGAIMWNVITWYAGIPSSSSHALVGGVIGSVLVAEGTAGVLWSGLAAKVVAPALVAPFVCGLAALVATRVAYRSTRRRSEAGVARGFRLSQILSSSLVALAHGTNDAQKTMGVIVLTLVAGGRLAPGSGVPAWVIVTCAIAVALGTFSGGWRVIRTLGTKVTPIAPPQGFSAETASATTILASSFFGFSLSTTQVVSGGVIGTGLARRGGIVHWLVVRRMVVAWALTVPAAGLIGASAEEMVAAFSSATTGVIAVAIVTTAVLAGIFRIAHRTNVTADNVLDEVEVPVAGEALAPVVVTP
ncbi:MAG TPA: inorganic phosphate transporter [Gaiellales bacterium]|nr:inorganic phosphate transporter [Gaiellales bacterium]